MRALAALALCGCAGTTGTVTVELVTAPDSHVLDGVQRIRMTLTQPHKVVDGARGPSGFDLALELDATSTGGALIVEGFDAGGARIACGQTPPFSLAALNATVRVYVAAPNSIAVAPAPLGGARSAVAGVPISYGAVLAGGIDGTTEAASSSIAIYNAYDHSLTEGVALPAPRSGMSIAAGPGSLVYLFGGADSDHQETGTLWQFDTAAPPMGSFLPILDQPGSARAGELMVPIDAAHYLITGVPALELVVGTTTTLTERHEVDGLPAAGAAVTGAMPTAVFAGAPLVRFRGEQFDRLTDGRIAAAVTTLPDGRIAVLGGAPATTDALVIDPASGAVGTVSGALSTPRTRPTVATTSRHVVVAGGSDANDEPIATADVLDARTLARLATLPILARSGGFAIALPNDQVLLGGGAPATAALELFTPEPP